APVRFIDAVSLAAEDVDMFVEVGPGHVLAGLAGEIVTRPTVSLDAGGESIAGWLKVAGAAWAMGTPINHRALFSGRITKPFSLDWKPRFFINPCELAPKKPANQRRNSPLVEAERFTEDRQPQGDIGAGAILTTAVAADAPLELIRHLVAARAELP